MEDSEKMILDDLREDIKILNKNTLYLCRHVTSTEARLENIERAMVINDKHTDLYGKQISELKGKLMGASLFIAIAVSCVMSFLV